jgi:Domain of unknown function (DUF4783)
MKQHKILFALLFMASCFEGFAQANDDLVANVKEAIKAGSAKELTNYLNDTVDLNLEDNQQNYSKAQAEFVLRDFFKSHAPTDFTILHKGSSKSGQPYAIGQYKSGTDNYRVFMKIKVVGNRQLVHEISFSKE